jgi:hypothetical protein
MTTLLRIDQDGLPSGEPGTSRTDGLAGGELVTLTDTGPGSAAEFRLLWTPPGDTGAVSSLAATGDPKVWTFTPTAACYGTYLVEDVGTGERRALVVRTPNRGLIIPAFGERGDPDASLFAPGSGELADNNATDFTDPDLNALPFAAWWRAMHELIMRVDAAGSSVFTLPDGFSVDVVPDDDLRGSLLTGANVVRALALTAGNWYSITVEIILKNATGPAYYVYRQQIEAYRDAGGAVIHYQPAVRPVEFPVGGSFSVVVAASGNNINTTLTNGSANTVNYAMYIGHSVKPIPS